MRNSSFTQIKDYINHNNKKNIASLATLKYFCKSPENGKT